MNYQVSEGNDRDRWEIVRNFACTKKGNGENGSGKLIWNSVYEESRITQCSLMNTFHFCRRNSIAFCQCCNASPSLLLTSNSSALTFWTAIELNSSAHRGALLLWTRYTYFCSWKQTIWRWFVWKNYLAYNFWNLSFHLASNRADEMFEFSMHRCVFCQALHFFIVDFEIF